MKTADDLLNLLAVKGGVVVGTDKLTQLGIAEARVDGRMYVNEDGLGFVVEYGCVAHPLFMHSQESELTDLRSQVAELQRTLKYERENPTFDGRLDSWQAACGRARQENEDWEKKCAELQRQLDEQAKQEPIGFEYQTYDVEECEWSMWQRAAKDMPPVNTVNRRFRPIYAFPPNLPAMIERARAEEREAIYAIAEEHFASESLKRHIRAMGEKK